MRWSVASYMVEPYMAEPSGCALFKTMLCFVMQNLLVGAPGELTGGVSGPTRGVWACAWGSGTPKDRHITLHDFLWISVEITISPKWSPKSPSTGHEQKSHTKNPTSPAYTLAVLESPFLAARSDFCFGRPATHGRYLGGNSSPVAARCVFPTIPEKSVFRVGRVFLCRGEGR